MIESTPKKRPTYIQALIPFLALLLFVSVGNIILKLRIEVMLILAASVSGIVALRLGYNWSDLEEAIGGKLKKTMPAILIMWSVGIIIGTFMFSGSIPILIFYGLKVVNPQYLFVFAFLLCMLLSSVTGTAWGSVGTAGIAMMGIAQGLGVPLTITAGAVISGSIFGDKMSPLSDTTNLSASTAGVDLYEHIRHMMYTTVVATVISLITFFVLGLKLIPDSNEISASAQEIINSLDSLFQWNVWMLLPLLIVFIGAFLKKATVPTMMLAAGFAIIIGALSNGFSFSDGTRAAIFGFNTSMFNSAGLGAEDIAGGVKTLVNRGGMKGMVGIIMIIFCGYSFISILSHIGCIDVVLKPMLNRIKTQGEAMLSAVLTSIFLCFASGTSYVPTIMLPDMFKGIFIKNKMKLRNLSRTLEDAGTCINPFVPWGISGTFYASTLGLSTWEYAPWVIFCWLTPILAIIYGFTGFGIAKLSDEEQQEELEKLKNEN